MNHPPEGVDVAASNSSISTHPGRALRWLAVAMSLPHRSRAATVWLGVLAGVIATVLLAPIITMGWCADAAEGGESYCGSIQTSLVGIETNVWLWAAAIVIVIVATAFVARRRRAESL